MSFHIGRNSRVSYSFRGKLNRRGRKAEKLLDRRIKNMLLAAKKVNNFEDALAFCFGYTRRSL